MTDSDPSQSDPEQDDVSGHGGDLGWQTWGLRSDPSSEVLGGRYLLQHEIGSGASSITYLGLDQRLGRRVAIKILRSHLTSDPAFTQRFEREARAAASVSHPHVVPVHDFGRHGDRLYIVMDYIEGDNLKERIMEGPLPYPEAVRIARQVLGGLTAIHSAGIIHRDIKPQNILIGRDGIARVADFGVAHLSRETGLTSTGTTLGTAAYMAPEQAQGDRLVPATDLYAVGVVLYEMLTGRLPFNAPSAAVAIYAHIYAQPVPPSKQIPGVDIPPMLDRLVLQAMAKRPEERFANAGDMRRALAAAVTSDGNGLLPSRIDAPSVTGSPSGFTAQSAVRSHGRGTEGSRPVPDPHRRNMGTLALLVLFLFGGGAAGAWMLGRDPEKKGDDMEPTAHIVAEAPSASGDEPVIGGGSTDQPFVLSPASTANMLNEAPVPTPSLTPMPTMTETPAPTQTPSPTSTSDPTQTPDATETPQTTQTLVPTREATGMAPIAAIGADDADRINEDGESQVIEPLRQEPTASDGDAEKADTQTVQRSFAAADWQGAYFQETGNSQAWSALYAQNTGYGQGSLSFTVEGNPASETFVLTVEGMTSENWSSLPIAIYVNGQEVYAGPSPFPTWNGVEGEQPWTAVNFELPSRLLRPGENTVTFANMVSEGGFSLPPYILLAGSTISVDV